LLPIGCPTSCPTCVSNIFMMMNTSHIELPTSVTLPSMAATTAGLQLIDRLLYQIVTIMSLCAFVSSSGSWTWTT
jgi:hypothetical protein